VNRFWQLLFFLAKVVQGSSRTSLGCRLRILILRLLGPLSELLGQGCYRRSCCERPGVMIFTSNHIWNPNRRTYCEQGEVRSPVTISDDAWIGARSIILPGVTVGRGFTVAAGSVVTRSTSDYSVIAGVPAVQLRINPIR